MISVEHLVFEYPTLRALNDVSFETKAGTITALVGPNGAGKTTLMRCIAALERPLSGSISVNGFDTHEAPRAVHRNMGYLSDFFGLYGDLTVRQSLIYAARRHGLSDSDPETAARRVGLADYLDTRAKELSRGLKQRLGIGQAILHDPKLVVLDEPASGLDPEARVALSELLIALRDGGMTVLVSSHILAELEDYATDILIMREGRIVEHRALGVAAEKMTFRIELLQSSHRLGEFLSARDDVSNLKVDGNVAVFRAANGLETASSILADAVSIGLPVCGLAPLHTSLQDAYIAHMRGEKVA